MQGNLSDVFGSDPRRAAQIPAARPGRFIFTPTAPHFMRVLAALSDGAITEVDMNEVKGVKVDDKTRPIGFEAKVERTIVYAAQINRAAEGGKYGPVVDISKPNEVVENRLRLMHTGDRRLRGL